MRVQNGIAEIFVNIAVKIIGARLGNHIHHRARVAPVFGIEGIGDDAKLLDAVGRGLDGRQVDELVVGIAAVYAEVVGAGAAAIDGNRTGIIGTKEKLPLLSQLRPARRAEAAGTDKYRAYSAATHSPSDH